jgi:hypothetical protein
VKVTEQTPVESNVQLVPIVPTVVSEDVKLTSPVGTFEAVVVSVTVTVHVEVLPTLIDAGAQVTLVEVSSKTGVDTLKVTVVV